MTTGSGHWADLLRQVLGGRPVVVATDVLVGAAQVAADLRAVGVDRLLPVAGIRGVGPLDPDVERDAVLLGRGGDAGHTSVMDGIRAWQAVLDDPPSTMVAAVDAFDPEHRAVVVPALFHVGTHVVDRPVLGPRRASWLALEDKTVVDALWDAAGVARAPARVVDLHDPVAVEAAAADLDRGDGTCWVADNTTGWHGGGEYLRWTGPGGDPTTAVAELAATGSRRARVMPFLDGRPCSVHGWVFDDGVVALRPCEMVVWRDDAHRFVYGGVATTWAPPPADREQMRDVARRVGRHLHATIGYRGSFSVDGVLTADGFLPTECNPRFGGGLARVAAGTGLPMYLLHLASIERPDLDWRPGELEALVLDAADASPVGRLMLSLPEGARAGGWRLVDDGDEWREAEPDERARAEVEVGPGVGGGMLAMVHLHGLDDGVAVAPVGVTLLDALAERVGVPLPALHAAPELRHA